MSPSTFKLPNSFGLWLDLLARTCLCLLLLLLVAVTVWRPLSNYSSFWTHAAVGRWISQHGEVPRQTLFLWSASEPWIDHSWLGDLVFYGLTALGPEPTTAYVVLSFTVVLVALSYFIPWLLWLRTSRCSSWMILLFALAVIANFHRYETGPELFTAVFLPCLLWFLVRWSGTPAAEQDRLGFRKVCRGAVVLVVLFAAWTNFHGGVVVGLFLLAATAACDLAQDRLDKRSRALALLTLLAALAVAVNPYGFRYWRAFEPLGSYRFAAITQWWPVWRLTQLPVADLAVQGFLVLLAVAAWAKSPQRRWSQLAWLLLLSALYAMANRNDWLLTIGSLMVLAANSRALVPERLWQILLRRPMRRDEAAEPQFPPVLRWAGRLWLAAWLVILMGLRAVHLHLYEDGYWPVYLDAGVVRFVNDHGLDGRSFNDFEGSKYLEWQLPDLPLFIDTHMAFPNAVMRDYLEIVQLTPRGRALLDKQPFDLVILTVQRPGPSLARLADFLDGDTRWRRVYAARDGVIWVRADPKYADVWREVHDTVLPVRFSMLELLYKGESDVYFRFIPSESR